MKISDYQTLLKASGYYLGPVDDRANDKMYVAADTIVNRHLEKLVGSRSLWPQQRVVVAAGQLILLFSGHEPGGIDGLEGHNTREAFNDWAHAQIAKEPRVIDRTPAPGYVPPVTGFPSQAGCPAFYGKPGLPGSAEEKAMSANMVFIDLPFAFRIDWQLDQKVTRIRLHRKCAEPYRLAEIEAVKHYGQAKYVALGLDRFAGSYMPRKMRGGSSFSMHAYGCAVDKYAAPNDLNTRAPKALFSHQEYVAYFDIMEAHGYISLGRSIGRDWMHVQAATL